MLTSSRLTRALFAFAAVLTGAAMLVHFANWRAQQAANWPAFFNITGVFVLAATGAYDPPPGRLRFALSAIAIVLILPSAALLLWRR